MGGGVVVGVLGAVGDIEFNLRVFGDVAVGVVGVVRGAVGSVTWHRRPLRWCSLCPCHRHR